MVQKLGETLCLGRDAVYRRLRGDTVLTADELIIISRKYKVPVDEGRDLSNVPVLHYYNGSEPIKSDEQYFQGLWEHTTNMVKQHNVRVDYATPELPIFYELSTPILRAFKVFVHGTTTWQLKKWEKVAFSPALLSPKTDELIERIIEHAYRLPGRELWSIGILDVTLRQISYMAQVGRFDNNSDLLAIFDELHTIVDHLEKMARSGKRFALGSEPKEDSPPFSVFHNELSNTNSAIVVSSDSMNVLFSMLINPNYIVSDDPRVLRDVGNWFERLVTNGNALNAEAGKYTNQYFRRLRQQIDAAKDRVAYANIIF